MSEASELFETLRAFKHKTKTGESSEKSLTDYCTNVLGGVERVHFDFKEKANPSNPSLDDADKKNLAKAISGFANGSGGVLIWGLKDKAIVPKPIARVSEFVDQLLQMSHNITDPAVPGVDADYLPSDDNSDSGFGLVFVPESSLPPHRAILRYKEIQNHYYVRSGSSFPIATHAQLADMFGRRPRPNLTIDLDAKVWDQGNEISITVSIKNVGRGLAKYPFLSLVVSPPYGITEYGVDGNGHFGLPVIERKGDFRSNYSKFYSSMKFGSQEGFAIHSGMSHPIAKIAASRSSMGNGGWKDLRFVYDVAAQGVPLRREERILAEGDLARIASN